MDVEEVAEKLCKVENDLQSVSTVFRVRQLADKNNSL